VGRTARAPARLPLSSASCSLGRRYSVAGSPPSGRQAATQEFSIGSASWRASAGIPMIASPHSRNGRGVLFSRQLPSRRQESNETAQGPDPQNLDFNDSKLDLMVNKTVITFGIFTPFLGPTRSPNSIGQVHPVGRSFAHGANRRALFP
jgi:hypothetical protein